MDPKQEHALEERRHEEKAGEEEDGHDHKPLPPPERLGELKDEDKALEEDRHDNELPVVEVLGEDGRERRQISPMPEGDPLTLEEHLQMLAEPTTYLHAVNGTTPGVRPTGNPEIGDLVQLAKGVSEHVQNYAVLAEVHDTYMTVMVLDEDRRRVKSQSWPSKNNVLMESVVGRLGKRVRVKPCNAKWHSCTSAGFRCCQAFML